MAKVSFVRGTDAQIEELEVTEGQIIVSESGALYVDTDTERIPISASEETIVAVYDTTTATSAHAVDSYVYVNDHLYVVTVAIAVGDTIAVGTNVTLATNLDANTPVYISGLPSSSGGDGGIPEGGTTGQVLVKLSNSDYDVGWGNATGGGVGTVVNIITTTTSFHNKTVTLTGTYATYSAVFDNTGHASVNVYYVGTYDIACEGFHNSVNVTAMGLVLTQGIDEDYCTVNLSSSDSNLEGATCTIYFGDPADDDVRQVTVVDSTLAFSFRATQIGSYTMISQYGGSSVTTSTTFTVSSLSGSMNVTIKSIPLKTFAAATDEEIVLMVQASNAGVIDLYDDCGWRVGQSRTKTIGAINDNSSYKGVSWSLSPNTYNKDTQVRSCEITLTLVHKGDIELTTPVPAKSGGNRKTCAFVVASTSVNNGDTSYMNGGINLNAYKTTTTASWSTANIRNWCNGGLRKSMEEAFGEIFSSAKVKSATNNGNNSLSTTNDYFTFAAEKEIFGSRSNSLSCEDALIPFSYYQTSANRKMDIGGTTSPQGTAIWTRSPSTRYSNTFCFITVDSNKLFVSNNGSVVQPEGDAWAGRVMFIGFI